MGYYNKKICSYSTRVKNCRKCNKKHSKTDHDCRVNFDGSAKSMEADMAVEMALKNPLFEKHNIFLARIVMDNDSSTICSLRDLSPHNIELWADKNHSVKAFSSSLYSLNLPKPIIDYFTSNLSNAIACNQGNAVKLKSSLLCMVPHAFGDHSLCTFHDKDKEYVYHKLPKQKPLEGEQMKTSLLDLMSRYILNVDKLAPAASTQGNESFNNTVATFCKKQRHYSDSESMCYRVAGAVCQKNIGFEYLHVIFNKIGLSLSSSGQSYRSTKQVKRIRKNSTQSSKKGKIRRKEIKQKRASKTTSNERREGITYESNVILNDLPEIPSTSVLQNVDPEKIDNFKIIYVDVETTGLTPSDEICQVLNLK